MPSCTEIAKVIFLITGLYTNCAMGQGAYYNEVRLRDVCYHRINEGWNPDLNCEWPWLAAWGKHEPEMLGEYVLAYLPGGGFRLCHIVDVRQEAHEEMNGHIILEISEAMAMEYGWNSYQEGVMVWRLSQ